MTAAVLTVSDSAARGEREDVSGPAVAEQLRSAGFKIMEQRVVADEQPAIATALTELASRALLVVTTGGTGIAERDVTPEATRAVCSRLIDGIPERIRAAGVTKTPYAVLSRGLCGVYGKSLILNLPGSPKGAVESLEAVIAILPHVIDLLAGKTSHAESHP